MICFLKLFKWKYDILLYIQYTEHVLHYLATGSYNCSLNMEISANIENGDILIFGSIHKMNHNINVFHHPSSIQLLVFTHSSSLCFFEFLSK